MRDLGTLGGTVSRAFGISAGGEVVVGGASNASGIFRAFRLISDIDCDGLPDAWERDGVPYVDSSGRTRYYILDSNGDEVSDANWLRKDLFVEVDVGNGVPFSRTSLNEVRDAFQVAPVTNPDGSNGITLHVVVDEIGIPLPSIFEEAILPNYRSQ
jgi:hypothetical protein